MGLTGCVGDDGRAAGGASSSPAGPSSPASEPAATDSCPASFPIGATPWVPAPPTTQTDGRLAPDADPVTAVVCRYRDVGPAPSEAGPSALVGEVALVGGLDRVRLDLLLPRLRPGQSSDCTVVGGPLVPHLVRFDYADGSLWVSSLQDADACQGSGNGVFVTAAHLGAALSASYDAGRWISPTAAG